MKRAKITFLDEKKIAKKAKKIYQDFKESQFSDNPINPKLAAFQKAKKDIKIDDLF